MLKRCLHVVVKKAREQSVLRDMPLCIIAYRPSEAEPVVWPSPGTAADVMRQIREQPELDRSNNKLESTDFLKQMNEKLRVKLSKVQLQRREGSSVHISSSSINDFLISTPSLVLETNHAPSHLKKKSWPKFRHTATPHMFQSFTKG
jgi:hypothetical protein